MCDTIQFRNFIYSAAIPYYESKQFYIAFRQLA